MANAVFITKSLSIYDDAPEEKYHFPKRYLKRVEQTIGDWIVYYEPRRANENESNRDGRQVYFAMARVIKVTPDQQTPGYFYAWISGYVQFTEPVPLKFEGNFIESVLRNPDGSINPGVSINAIRIMPPADFEMICRLGMISASKDVHSDAEAVVAETQAEYGGPRKSVQISRALRDVAFTRVVRNAYDSTCAMTGLKIINGGGRCEIEAAHIKPVEDHGPDSPRNGIALSRTIHWLFDRGFLSLEDNGQILIAKGKVPEPVQRLINPEGYILIPKTEALQPHKTFLRYHRENKYKG